MLRSQGAQRAGPIHPSLDPGDPRGTALWGAKMAGFPREKLQNYGQNGGFLWKNWGIQGQKYGKTWEQWGINMGNIWKTWEN